jgi:hypothetical protein
MQQFEIYFVWLCLFQFRFSERYYTIFVFFFLICPSPRTSTHKAPPPQFIAPDPSKCTKVLLLFYSQLPENISKCFPLPEDPLLFVLSVVRNRSYNKITCLIRRPSFSLDDASSYVASCRHVSYLLTISGLWEYFCIGRAVLARAAWRVGVCVCVSACPLSTPRFTFTSKYNAAKSGWLCPASR